MLAPWAQQQILTYLFTGDAMGTRPTSWFVAIHTGDPGTGDDNELTTGADSEYERKAVTFAVGLDGTEYEAATLGDVTFDPAGAGTSYTATHFTIKDALTGGNTLAKAAFPVPIPVVAGGVVSFPLGELLIEGGV